MNMFYTGLGIARSLGENGVPVIGLSAQPGIYGNYTRYARVVFAPDSRTEPQALAAFLVELGKSFGERAVIFPTRDDDVMFLDRYRKLLEPYFTITAPETSVLAICLDKWETYRSACAAGVATPKCWLVENEKSLPRILSEITYPCVLKPVAAHQWRQSANWELVGGRKAIQISSPEELLAEYAAVSRANERALLQEMIPGDDRCLVIAACYLDRNSKWVDAFNTQKLVQAPEGFGTGCIVQSVERPEIIEFARRLLEHLGFTGIAEVEFKWDVARQVYQLIEINPRPWDQHRLGAGCGTDLIYLAYCDHAGLPLPARVRKPTGQKWIAEDTFLFEALRLFWRRDPGWRELFAFARGKRIYAIWSWRDPLPMAIYLVRRLIPRVLATAWRGLRQARKSPATPSMLHTASAYPKPWQKGKSDA
jgi:predicted ATP-grasp superfamily ATP-dependent carboligase